MKQKQSIWKHINQIPSNQPHHQLKLCKLGALRKDRYLICYHNQLVIFQDHLYTKPLKSLNLDFETKFEVFRCPPIIKQEKRNSNKIKPEDILKLGDIVSIKLSLESSERVYEISGSGDQLNILRQFLGKRINQLGFHNMFRVFKKIGKGNFASVYLAERIEDNIRMAVKAFSKQTVYGEDKGKEGLINEIQIMRELDSPNIMKLYEVYETQNSIYMGLELLEGDQLFEYMKKKTIFSNAQIQVIMTGLLMGLKHMHNKGIMHRDIKLENILFKKQNQLDSVVIADFGLATYINQKPYLYSRCGTPGFVAPEIINLRNPNAQYDSVCDVYSLGLIFYILLTGRPAFQGKSYNSIVQQNKESIINFNIPAFEVVSEAAKDLLKKMVMREPALRIRSADALNHEYLYHVSQFVQDEDDINMQDDDDHNLSHRVDKINEVAQKLDMLRLKQNRISYNMKSPEIHHTRDLKIDNLVLDEETIVMRTPVITGRVEQFDGGSPQIHIDISPFMVAKELSQDQLQQKEVLSKYTLNK
ncbi:hypothetical protein pb186bvf_006646 [Paramecium bursaria]